MKKLSKKRVLLFAAVMALCVLAMPSMASAGTWDPVGPHTITSPAVVASIPAIGMGWACHTELVVDASGTSQLTVTSATFTNCTGTGTATGCGIDAVQGSGPDWVVDGSNTSAMQIANVDVNLTFTSGCGFAGSLVNVAGTLATGGFDNATSSLSLTDSTGLEASVAGSSLGPVSVDGGLTDTAGTLTLS